MFKLPVLCFVFFLVTPAFATEIEQVIETIIDEVEMSCFYDREEVTLSVLLNSDILYFKSQDCSVEISVSDLSEFQDLENRKTKWICSVAGAGKKSKCFKVNK